MEPQAKVTRFEVIAVDPRSGLMEAKVCEVNAEGRYRPIRMSLQRLQ
jgi:hypothetical protein